MSTGANIRKKAAESVEAKDSDVPDDIRKFELAAKSFAQLAENEEWLAQNFNNIIHSHELNSPNEALGNDLDNGGIAKLEEHILRCLGAAVIMEWSNIPSKLQRELFDTAGSLGDVLQTVVLRGQIARYLHSHKYGGVPADASGKSRSTKGTPDGA